MYTEVDCRKGLVRTTWKNIRARVQSVNAKFTELVDELSPDNFSVYLMYLPYGQLIGDTQSQFLPDCADQIHRLNSPNLPKTLINELGYGARSSPLGMVLEKNIEYYIDIPKLRLTLPRIVRTPGCLFPMSFIYKNSTRNYTPSNILNQMSGCRSAFMLPHINSKSHYERLQYDYNLKSPRPESLYQHFDIFKELASQSHIESPWRSCIMYFSVEWTEKILSDPAWYKIKMYLSEQSLSYVEPEAHKYLLDFVFSYIQILKNLKPNPYIVDTARHIINTAVGNVPGYVPANDEASLPIADIEEPFIESYGMKKYFPTILHAKQFIFEQDVDPIYYSMQYPSTHNFSPKSRNASSMLVEMRELSTILNIFLEYLSDKHEFCQGTVYSEITKYLEILCIHNQEDKHRITNLSAQVLAADQRFQSNYQYKEMNEQRFAADGKFFRGCIMIKRK